MATADQLTDVKFVEKRVRAGVLLTLSHAEAWVLAQIMGHIGGRPDGLRVHMQAIDDALKAAGYVWSANNPHDAEGSIYFRGIKHDAIPTPDLEG